MTLRTTRIRIKGDRPLLQSNQRMINPLDEHSILLKKLAAKRNKTDEDLKAISKAEFVGRLYYSGALGGVYVPDEWIESCIRDGARKSKKGKVATASVYTTERGFPLIYEGPRTPDDLFAAGSEFVDIRAVRVSQARLMRTRPIFQVWSLEFSVQWDPLSLDSEQLIDWIEIAGRVVGMGDYRPKYGRFFVEWVKDESSD